MPLDLSADERKELAQDLAAELDTGRYGSRFVLSRRQLLSIAGGSAGVAGLTALGVDPATAQSAAGQVGTESSPEDVFAYDLDVQGALQRDLDAGGQVISNVGSVSAEQFSLTPLVDFTAQFSSGETKPAFNTTGNLGDRLIIEAVPENGPGNDHGYTVDRYWDTSSGQIKMDITETENDGGGTARVTVWRIGV